MRIVFAGTPEFAAEHLRFLINEKKYEVIGVYTQPDRPAGRGKNLTSSPVKRLAQTHALTVYQPETLRDANAQQVLANLKPDLMIVVAYGLILPKAVLSIPRYGCINVHASLLPRWRGAAPIQRAIEAGDTETGITVMQMDEGLDTGDMLLKSVCTIASDETTASLHEKLLVLGGPALGEVLQQIANNKLKPEKQNNKESCYAPKITKAEAKIDWTLPAEILERKIRAFNPFPISFFEVNNNMVRVWKGKFLNESTTAKPGTILSSAKEGIKVATSEKILLLEQLQLPGKKSLPVSDVLNGYAEWFSAGTILH